MVRVFVVQIARIVELPEPVHGVANDAPLLSLITDALVDDDDVQIGLLVPATPGPGAEEDGTINGRFSHQVPAEGDGVRVGTCVADRGHLVADAVSPHRGHGAVTFQPGSGRPLFRGMLLDVATGASSDGIREV